MKEPGTVLAISGGVGGAKLAHGLAAVTSDLAIVVNTGDDFEHLGLCISPDIDSVLYGISGRNDQVRGWGRKDETWNFMASLAEINDSATWFNVGDRDLAIHVERTRRLRAGESLSAITADFARSFGINARVTPATDDQLRTIVATDHGELSFQQYFVREQCKPSVCGFRFEGAESASLSPAIIELCKQRVEAVIICPSNPFVSIAPVLAVPGLSRLLRETGAPIVAVSPIVGGGALKGPAAKMMSERGYESSAVGIGCYYQDFVDGLVIDHSDEGLAQSIRSLGLDVAVEPIVMRTDEDKKNLAHRTLAFAARIGSKRSMR